MLDFWRTQRSPRVQSREGSISRDAESRPSADDPCYVQLPRVEDEEKEAIPHGQKGRAKMALTSRRAASASSDKIPLLLDKEEERVESQLADVEDDVPPAPRRLEEVPLVGAPAVEEDEATKSLRPRTKIAVLGFADKAKLEQLRKDLASLPSGQAERVLTTGDWDYGSAIHLAACSCKEGNVFEVLLHGRRHLLNLKDEYGRTPLYRVVERGGLDHLVKKFVELGGKDLLIAQDKDGKTALHYVAKRGGGDDLVKKFVECGGKDLLKAQDQDGHTPLHFAAASGNASILETMLEVAPDLLNATDKNGRTPLHSAAENDCAGVVVLMLKMEPELLTMQSVGRTAHINLRLEIRNVHDSSEGQLSIIPSSATS
ncbi:unnamed protein product [Vitrella brassicaformis CCMP3155]|uniref:Uncharacterized protein n=1 Tax=Vitrella brassicaformis (strain CCMP3155) TaxID=1169540 RepID=A0A0G4GHW7_VITBC|nr:unnamed protein product [Vitrella brassicaformis CCMP3155]|eukprot:CEM29334.1 unnamed protein product [Vitrella brassicaformis CCMP3155]